MKHKLKFSVVICTRNRISQLKRCISSLVSQTYAPEEIIIVDDCSDADFNVCEFFENELCKLRFDFADMALGIHIILIKNKKSAGVVASRNAGINAATGEVVAFLDDDCIAHKRWLKNLSANYHKKDTLGVGGPVIEIGRKLKFVSKPIKNLAYVKNGKIITNYRIKNIKDKQFLPKKFVKFLQGGNMSFRKDALVTVKGGDVNLTGNCYREETDLCFRIAKNGKILFEPSAITYHDTANKGGCRDVINFDIDRFLYFVFRNTTYFFFKHFNLKKAVFHTIKSFRFQAKMIRKNKTGLNRDYLKLKDKNKTLKSMVAGTLSGLVCWLKTRKREAEFVYSQPKYLKCFKLLIIGGSLKIIELEHKTHLIKSLFKR